MKKGEDESFVTPSVVATIVAIVTGIGASLSAVQIKVGDLTSDPNLWSEFHTDKEANHRKEIVDREIARIYSKIDTLTDSRVEILQAQQAIINGFNNIKEKNQQQYNEVMRKLDVLKIKGIKNE